MGKHTKIFEERFGRMLQGLMDKKLFELTKDIPMGKTNEPYWECPVFGTEKFLSWIEYPERH